MSDFEGYVEKAIKDNVLQGCVAYAQDKSGKLSYAKAFGKQSLDADAKDWQLDTTLQIASMTKLLTSVAVLQVVERGLIGLDDDVAKYVPELPAQGLLKAVDAHGKAMTEPLKNKVTLRLLLTHSAGTIYDFFDPRLSQVKQAKGLPPGGGSTIDERALYPFVYEPGKA